MIRRGLLVLTLVLVARPGWAARSCPSYQVGTSDGTHHCGAAAHPGQDPTPDEWNAIFATVAQGPKRWGARGVPIPDLHAGCSPVKSVPATFPCEVLKALAKQESSWHQFCAPTEPTSEKGKPTQTLIARDCGYGAFQVTSGMHDGETAPFDRERVASDALYNATVGASILASKWQGARCLENRDPAVLEHWYIALWKYNGYSYSNDPSNPIFSSTRGVYNPAIAESAPYQEKIFGIIENGAGKLWKPIPLAYPRIEDVAGRKSDPVAKVECASPTDCTTTRPTHHSVCSLAAADTLADAGAGARPPEDAAGKLASGAGGVDAASAAHPGNGGCGCRLGAESSSAQVWGALHLVPLFLLALRLRRPRR